ncbi:hypothetical protein PlfCFBP13513_19010 [Plantibacter flavus]|uniref:hypothetical protein n=1 Tax=Plantibacter TaxID=190323 RepID=UPI0010C19763|nr:MULTISPECIES: hypothetical protein [Plantibacter]MBD8535138.1 hypothetical protein [Plantibacter sp. CFBP 13570]TKJ95875.1 hypothetical protein PlfCFBP13513_19010 [Plantibacter flavus]
MTAPVRLLSGLAGTPSVWRPLTQAIGREVEVEIPAPPWASPDGDELPRLALVEDFLAAACSGAELVVAHSYAATLLLGYLCVARRRGLPTPGRTVLVSTFYQGARAEVRWTDLASFVERFDEVLAEGIRASGIRADAPSDRVLDMARHVRERIGAYGWLAFYTAYLHSADLPVHDLPGGIRLAHGALDTAAPPSGSRRLRARTREAGLDLPLLELDRSAHFPMVDDPMSLHHWCIAPPDVGAPHRGPDSTPRPSPHPHHAWKASL